MSATPIHFDDGAAYERAPAPRCTTLGPIVSAHATTRSGGHLP
ncbi:hypothetical protein [Sorangium sp. So ce1153]